MNPIAPGAYVTWSSTVAVGAYPNWKTVFATTNNAVDPREQLGIVVSVARLKPTLMFLHEQYVVEDTSEGEPTHAYVVTDDWMGWKRISWLKPVKMRVRVQGTEDER